MKLFLTLIAFTLLLVGCTDYRSKYEDLINQNSAIQKRLNELEEEDKLVRGEYSAAIEVLNSIDDTLRSISLRELEIQELTQSREFNGSLSQRQKILAKIQQLRDENEIAKDEAKRMQRRVRSYQIENQQLKKMISQAESRIFEKEEELSEAREIIDDMEYALSRMEAQLTEKSGQLDDAYEDLRRKNEDLQQTNQTLEKTIRDLKNKNQFIDEQARAYVVCGDKRSLRKTGILSPTSIKKLTKNYQTSVKRVGDVINYFDNDVLNCGTDGEILSVLPPRDASSYKIEGSRVEILQPKKFWETDKTVVLLKK